MTLPKRATFSSFIPKFNTWEEIFSETKSESNVDIWNTGKIKVPVKGLLNTRHKDAPILHGKKIFVDVPVYLVKTENHGTFLIDTGLDKSFKEDRLKHATGLFSRFSMYDARQEKGQSVFERLNTENISLSAIFFTHLHFDHTGGLADLNPTYPIIIGKNAKPIDIPIMFRTKHLDHISEMQELDFSSSISIHPFSEVIDVFGDNTVFAINTDGHTKGHVSYLINSCDGLYLIAGDQVSVREQLSSGVGPGKYSNDIIKAQQYFDQIVEFMTLYPETKLYMGHDII